MISSLRAVIVDDDVPRSRGFKDAWQKILERAYADVEVKVFHDIASVAEVFAGRPHIVIVDNVFPDSTGALVPNRGVDFIVETKARQSDSLFVLVTGNTFQIDVLGYKFPNADLIATKTPLGNSAYQAYLSTRISEQLQRFPVGEITFTDPRDSQKLAAGREEIRSLVEQCLIDVHSRDASDAFSQIQLQRLGGGYSGADVFVANVFGLKRHNNAPLVFKMGERDSVSDEAARYNRFVRLQMPHDMRVDLLGTGRAGKYSGAVYSFAFGETAGIESASAQIAKGNYTAIGTVIDRVLLSDSIGWYKSVEFAEDVGNFYNNSVEYAPRKDSRRIDRLRIGLESIFGNSVIANEEQYQFGRVKVPHVRRNLAKFFGARIPVTICHGDLNTNNIILGPAPKSLALIDFAFTGPDSLYKDYVSLEASFRTYWNAQEWEEREEFMSLYRAECAANDGKEPIKALREFPALEEYFEVVKGIRGAAATAAAVAKIDFSQEVYILALAFHMLKLCGLGIWDRSNEIKTIACLMACCKYLDEMEG